MNPPRPLLYDLTHLSQRAEIAAPSGIDRVDLMFARRFAASPQLAAAVHYGRRRPSLLAPSELADVVSRAERRWSGTAQADPAFVRLKARILGREPPACSVRFSEAPPWRRELIRRARIGRYKLVSRGQTPEGAVYLNVAQHALERPSHFDWLQTRRDILPVFFLHDLLPLDYPEFWPAGHEAQFSARVETLFAFARGIVTSSETVAERIREEYRRRGLSAPPLLAQPLPSPLRCARAVPTSDPDLAAEPYFVIVGTIEPRKNHLMLLNLWRAMIESGERPPKLVIVGVRGWLNAETTAALDRGRALQGFVFEAAGLNDEALRVLLTSARGVLAPSFSEGYGLPIVEALELGVPVVASDLSIFREVTQGHAILINHAHGAAWRAAVLGLADVTSLFACKARSNVASFSQLDPSYYFHCVDEFLRSI